LVLVFSFWFTDPFVSVLDLPCSWFRLLPCFVAAVLWVSVGTVVGSVGAAVCWLLEMGDGAAAADGEAAMERGWLSGLHSSWQIW
jgi:hypothetical protein